MALEKIVVGEVTDNGVVVVAAKSRIEIVNDNINGVTNVFIQNNLVCVLTPGNAITGTQIGFNLNVIAGALGSMNKQQFDKGLFTKS